MKLIKLGLICCASLLLPVTGFAQDRQEGTTEVTADVPSTYTMTIPASPKQIVANTDITDLGSLSVKGNLDPTKLIEVTVEKKQLENQRDNTQKIPFSLVDSSNANTEWTGATWNADDCTAAKALELSVKIDQPSWAAAKPGQYKGSIVFTSSIIDNE
ncbi:hypothetical protein JZO70_12585 [Enterococcus sp. 669A]|uniref:WxL domain-containing protein n=1 Tax=Candidatus Enterococcus moelleringii TaxID=2815325 RepID=A0ABS3LD36_9ENTE|nr:hypothetical protein [Enterococcus sp. 669A]MBO1307005.1 hypothetical protein [Enterococcus sp. 669A]